MDGQVWNNFLNTIEKRSDGYYVRSWKKTEMELPDNKAIAHKRLRNLWNSLKKDEELLERYNELFKEQLRSSTIEKV